MAEIEVHCEVPLAEPIVLATQADTHYAPIQWKLSSGDQVVIRMDAPEAAAKAHWAGHSSTPNYFVNTRVEKVVAVLTVANVSAIDISRLLGTNSSEETFHAHFETHQVRWTSTTSVPRNLGGASCRTLKRPQTQ